INDIKATLRGVNEKVVKGNFQLADFYQSYLSLSTKNVEKFKVDIQEKALEVDKEIERAEDLHSDYLEKVLMIASLSQISNLYRRAAEKLVDELIEEKPGKGHK
ncbi:MAG TPA: hypothetical protein VJ558_08275, partial [Bacillales bacterium]|nr:hypothetical protein [Bacillales bacterium]